MYVKGGALLVQPQNECEFWLASVHFDRAKASLVGYQLGE
jgi:hypothetical protein